MLGQNITFIVFQKLISLMGTYILDMPVSSKNLGLDDNQARG
jgi:hypothetical protein